MSRVDEMWEELEAELNEELESLEEHEEDTTNKGCNTVITTDKGCTPDIFGKDEEKWAPYTGPKGGEGWRNVDTDEVLYTDEPPGKVVEAISNVPDDFSGFELFEDFDVDDLKSLSLDDLEPESQEVFNEYLESDDFGFRLRDTIEDQNDPKLYAMVYYDGLENKEPKRRLDHDYREMARECIRNFDFHPDLVDIDEDRVNAILANSDTKEKAEIAELISKGLFGELNSRNVYGSEERYSQRDLKENIRQIDDVKYLETLLEIHEEDFGQTWQGDVGRVIQGQYDKQIYDFEPERGVKEGTPFEGWEQDDVTAAMSFMMVSNFDSDIISEDSRPHREKWDKFLHTLEPEEIAEALSDVIFFSNIIDPADKRYKPDSFKQDDGEVTHEFKPDDEVDIEMEEGWTVRVQEGYVKTDGTLVEDQGDSITLNVNGNEKEYDKALIAEVHEPVDTSYVQREVSRHEYDMGSSVHGAIMANVKGEDFFNMIDTLLDRADQVANDYQKRNIGFDPDPEFSDLDVDEMKKEILNSALTYGGSPTDRQQLLQEVANEYPELTEKMREKDYEVDHEHKKTVNDGLWVQFEEDFDQWALHWIHGWSVRGGSDVARLTQIALDDYGPNNDGNSIPWTGNVPMSAVEVDDTLKGHLQQMHELAQEYTGDSPMELYRGTKREVSCHSNAESWTSLKSVANDFDDYILEAEADPEDIIFTYDMFGDEWPEEDLRGKKEFIVLGGAFDD